MKRFLMASLVIGCTLTLMGCFGRGNDHHGHGSSGGGNGDSSPARTQFPNAKVVKDDVAINAPEAANVNAAIAANDIDVDPNHAIREGSWELYEKPTSKVIMKVLGGNTKDLTLLDNDFLQAKKDIHPNDPYYNNLIVDMKRTAPPECAAVADKVTHVTQELNVYATKNKDLNLEHSTFGSWYATYWLDKGYERVISNGATIGFDRYHQAQPFYGGDVVQINPATGTYTGKAIGEAQTEDSPWQPVSGTAKLTVTGTQAGLVVDFPS